MRPRHLLALLVPCVTSLVLLGPQDSSAFDTKGYPPEMVAAARLTTQRCTKCHTIVRVVDANFDPDIWETVVEDMARKEKSGISAPEAARIASFLAFHASKKSGTKPAESRPGAAAGAGASRPARFGWTAAYPSPTYTVHASGSVPASARLPATLELEGVTVVIEDVSAASDATGARASATVNVGGTRSRLVLARDAAGAFSPEVAQIRSWTIGPHAFQLVLALHEADPAPTSSERPSVVLALLVMRSGTREPAVAR
jgi:hypothetical protein